MADRWRRGPGVDRFRAGAGGGRRSSIYHSLHTPLTQPFYSLQRIAFKLIQSNSIGGVIIQTERQKEYHKYLASEDWKRRGSELREAWGNKCAFCGATEHLNLHHLDYGNLGAETVKDVVLLCKGCHLKAHKGKLKIWGFTQEERDAFEKVKHIVCDNRCSYRFYTYRKETQHEDDLEQ